MRLKGSDLADAFVESRIAKRLNECCLLLEGFRLGGGCTGAGAVHGFWIDRLLVVTLSRKPFGPNESIVLFDPP
jgi:hypothetical protein